MIRVNLLGVPRAKRRRARAPMVTMEGSFALALLAVLLVAVAVVQYVRYNRLRAEGDQLTTEISQLQQEKIELAQVQSQYETFSRRKELLTARINVIESLKAAQSGPVVLLNTLANTVSSTDSLWLTSFQKTGDKLTVNGTTLNMRYVADLITRLKNSKTFQEVNLKETAQDASKDIDTFNFVLEVQLAPPGGASSSQPGTQPRTS